MTQKPPPEAASPEHLTGALRKFSSLANVRVCDVVVESSRATILSEITRLRLTYDGEASDAPRTIILKTGLPDRLGDANWDAGRQEVAFYNEVAAVKPGQHVLRCFEAAWDADTRAWHLLLEDLTDTHVIATAWPLPPQRNSAKTSSAPAPVFMPSGGMSLVLAILWGLGRTKPQ